MNVTEIIAIKFQAHQYKRVTVHTTELTNGNNQRRNVVYTARIHKTKRDRALLSLSDSADFNNAVKTRSDILNGRLSPKPNLLLTLSR